MDANLETPLAEKFARAGIMMPNAKDGAPLAALAAKVLDETHTQRRAVRTQCTGPPII